MGRKADDFRIIPYVLEPFLREPGREFGVRELARELEISPTTASTHLRACAKAGVLKERQKSNLKLYRRNIDSDFYRDLKVFHTVRTLKDSGLIDALNDFYPSPTIILFGSSSKGYDVFGSDVDLAVISENTEEFPKQSEYERKLGKELHIFAVKTLKGLRNEHLVSNVIDGITLQGGKTWGSMSASLRERLLQPPRIPNS